ncbi:MAG: protein translocase subunit SecD [Chitinispirillaceae bacterium]
MKKNTPIWLVVIIVTTALAVWYLYPSFIFYSKSPAERSATLQDNPELLSRVINLGLDLQGGMRLVLEIDRSKIKDEAAGDVQDRAYAVIENRINALGVAEPTIQMQGDDRLIVELPGLSDRDAAKQVIGSTAQLEFQLLREPEELQRAIRVVDNAMQRRTPGDTSEADTAAEQQEQEDGVRGLFEGTETEQDTADTAVAADQPDIMPGSFSEYLVSVGQQVGVAERNREKVNQILARDDVQLALERAGFGGSEFLWGHETQTLNGTIHRPLYFVKSRAELRGDIVADARATISQGGMEAGQAIVNLELNREGARRFSRVTGANVNKFLAIVLDNTVYSAPQIRQKIPGGQAQITGDFTLDEANNLAIILRAGALPAPVNIIEERTVGPSLGQDSIMKGLYACIVGFGIVILFMAFYYKGAGLIADIALLLNLIFLMALMTSINATLTLPGIAGIVLIIGMAVDANVIIFERIREELDIGKTVRSAIESGYDRAFVTVMDANITTLITAFILLWVGTGPIRGFAVTLIIGIIVSLFTALIVTRVIFSLSTGSKKVQKLSI